MKKKSKNNLIKILIGISILIIALFIGRGCVYRTFVDYKDAGGRKTYKVKDKNFILFIENNLPDTEAKDIESIIETSLKLTDKALSFSSSAKEKDPNKLVLLGEANYMGYAAFTAAVGNYLIDKYKLSQVWEAKPVKGKLFMFGNDIYSKTKNTMFKDNDFVIFRNKMKGKEIAVDPTIYDKYGVDRISKY